MKKIKFIALLVIVTGLFSCAALSKLTQFDIDYTAKFSVPLIMVIDSPVIIPTPPIETDISDKLGDNNSAKNLIEELLLKEMNLKIETPAGQTFSFLNNIDLYMNADNLSRIKIAYKHNVASSVGADLELDIVADQDLQAYLLGDKFILEIEVTTDEVVSEAIDMEVDMKFMVDAKILGF